MDRHPIFDANLAQLSICDGITYTKHPCHPHGIHMHTHTHTRSSSQPLNVCCVCVCVRVRVQVRVRAGVTVPYKKWQCQPIKVVRVRLLTIHKKRRDGANKNNSRWVWTCSLCVWPHARNDVLIVGLRANRMESPAHTQHTHTGNCSTTEQPLMKPFIGCTLHRFCVEQAHVTVLWWSVPCSMPQQNRGGQGQSTQWHFVWVQTFGNLRTFISAANEI